MSDVEPQEPEPADPPVEEAEALRVEPPRGPRLEPLVTAEET